MPTWFRRRNVWLPTWQGTLLLFALVAIVLVVAVRHLGTYLAPTEPALGRDGAGARTLVVEGWLEEDDLEAAIAVAAHGRYRRIVTSGGPIDGWREDRRWPTYAERAADYLRRHGSGALVVTALPAPASAEDRTYLSALVVRDGLRRQGAEIDSIDVFSAGVHARRSRLIYRMAFGNDVEVGIFATRPRRYALDQWWATSEGAKAAVGELLSLAWTRCCFWPGAGGVHDERTAIPKSSA